MAPDPRQGLTKQLDLLEAYKIYERDYPVKLPNISATLAINSPLYTRIEETLKEQTQGIAEHHADAAATRRISTEANVPYATLVQLMQAMQPPAVAPAQPQVQRSLSTAASQTEAAEDARLQATEQSLVEGRVRLEQDTATASTAIQRMTQAVAAPITNLVDMLRSIERPAGPVVHNYNAPIGNAFHQYNQQNVDARQVHQNLVQVDASTDARSVQQVVQDNRAVILNEMNISVDQRRFYETHHNQILEFSQQNQIDIRVAAQMLFARSHRGRRRQRPAEDAPLALEGGQLALQDGPLAIQDSEQMPPPRPRAKAKTGNRHQSAGPSGGAVPKATPGLQDTGPLGPRPKAKSRGRANAPEPSRDRVRTPRPKARNYGRFAAGETLSRQL